jgi:hypothetical protein
VWLDDISPLNRVLGIPKTIWALDRLNKFPTISAQRWHGIAVLPPRFLGVVLLST